MRYSVSLPQLADILFLNQLRPTIDDADDTHAAPIDNDVRT